MREEAALVKRLEVVAATSACVLLVGQFAAGGLPRTRARQAREARGREEDVVAAEALRERARAESALREKYVREVDAAFRASASASLPETGVPAAWLDALGPASRRALDWEEGETCRLRARGRFFEIADLLAAIDREAGSLSVRSLDLEPEGERVVLTVLFSRPGEG
jgi:hypothetical protein